MNFNRTKRGKLLRALLVVSGLASSLAVQAGTDTLRVMTYNVLYYGNGCQGPNYKYHEYLKTITAYARPDLFGMVKMASIPQSADDKAGTAPVGFADSIVQYALNAAIPGKYAYCPFTNAAHGNNQAILFYDKNKLGFVTMVSSYVNITDFNTYKLYYKDPNLSQTHDTTFLYVTLNHDKSGKENEAVRAIQIGEEMKHVKEHFTSLPNYINMGDFNVRSSEEPFYQELTQTSDENFRLYDPPFSADKVLSYPADWGHDSKYAAYFTTSTRESESVPNACGSGGGGKDWYDHIFLSSWIVNNTCNMRYIPHSYRTLGNDGQRFKVSINNSNVHPNTSAPTDVIEALYQFSNKYPVLLDLEVKTGAGTHPKNTEIAGVAVLAKEQVKVELTERQGSDNAKINIVFPEALLGQQVTIICADASGKEKLKKEIAKLKATDLQLSITLEPGSYTVKISGKHNVISETKITKK